MAKISVIPMDHQPGSFCVHGPDEVSDAFIHPHGYGYTVRYWAANGFPAYVEGLDRDPPPAWPARWVTRSRVMSLADAIHFCERVL